MNELLTVGIPTLAVLVGILVNNSRLSDQHAHIDKRFDSIDKQFDDFKDLMNAKFESAHAYLIRLEQVMDARIKHVEPRA